MDLTGLIDFDAEIKKLEKSLGKTMPALTSLETKMAAAGYDENVSDELKQANTEKLEALKVKVSEIEAAIENFKQLALKEKN
jgi:valyl-tRNA synthetase